MIVQGVDNAEPNIDNKFATMELTDPAGGSSRPVTGQRGGSEAVRLFHSDLIKLHSFIC